MTLTISGERPSTGAVDDRVVQLKSIAARLMWWLAPEAALARPARFVMQVMALGTWQDVQTVSEAFGWEAFHQALEQAEPGVFDGRSWAYWHAFFGLPEPDLPRRPLT
ncbi:MAG: hypothetical protein HZA90_08935 [Verrucomicrobia bacterium]|nr:hypothetical protein [Verrucomicrobiota bacterium]